MCADDPTSIGHIACEQAMIVAYCEYVQVAGANEINLPGVLRKELERHFRAVPRDSGSSKDKDRDKESNNPSPLAAKVWEGLGFRVYLGFGVRV